eukprot:521899_1
MNPTDDFESKLNQNDNNNSQTHPSQATFNPTDDPSTDSDHDHDLSQATFDIHPTDDPITDSYSAHNHNDVSPLDANTIQMLDKLKQCMIVLQPNNAETVLITSKLNELEAYFKREAYEYDDIVSDLNEKHDQSLIYAFCEDTLGDITIFHTLDACTSIRVPTVSAIPNPSGAHADTDIGSKLDELTNRLKSITSIGDASTEEHKDTENASNHDEHGDTDGGMSSGQRSIERETEAYMEEFSDGEIHSLQAILSGTNANEQSIDAQLEETEFDALLDEALSDTEQDGSMDAKTDEDNASSSTQTGDDEEEEEDDEESETGSDEGTSHTGTSSGSTSEEETNSSQYSNDSSEEDTECEDTIVYSGYLWKESVFKNRFNQHWAHIVEDKLFIFKNRNDAEPIRMYDLKLYDDVNVISESNDDASHCDFQLISTQTSAKQMFRVNSAEEMNEWTQYIKQCQPIPEPLEETHATPEPLIAIEPKEEPIQTDNTANDIEPSRVAEDEAIATTIDTHDDGHNPMDDVDDNKNEAQDTHNEARDVTEDENESTNRRIEMRSAFVSDRKRHNRNGLEMTKDIKQEIYEDPDADDDTDDDAQPPLTVQAGSNASGKPKHEQIDLISSIQDNVKSNNGNQSDTQVINMDDTGQPDVNEQLNPELDMNTHQPSTKWQKSLMKTNIEQTVYEDPDLDETEQKVTKAPPKEDTKESKKDVTHSLKEVVYQQYEKQRVDYEYDEEYTTQWTVKWQNVIHAIKQELYKKIGKRINKIVENKENEIDQSDLSDD